MPSSIQFRLDLTEVAERLLREGVAPYHVRRAVAELQDHFTDLYAEAVGRGLSDSDAQADARTRLGKEDDLVREILSKPELKSWASRWPWLVYGLGPILGMFIAVCASILIVGGGLELGKAITGARYIPPLWSQTIIDTVFLSVMYLLPLIIAAWVSVQAIARRSSLFWPLLGLVVLCIVAAAFDVSITWPATMEKKGFLTLGFAYAAPFPISSETYGRALANLVFSGMFLLWCRSRHSA